MQPVKTENNGNRHGYVEDIDICTSSDDRNDWPLPPIQSFTLPVTTTTTTDSEDKPTSSTRDVVTLIGKRRPIKIHIGWMHKVGDKYRQVRRKYGGGTRELILDNLNIYPAELVQRAITLFFPEGASQVVSVDEVESFALGNFCGEELERFSDERGNECSLGQYLKAQGTYASRCYIYLLTKKKMSPKSTKSFASESVSRRKRPAKGNCVDHRISSSFGHSHDIPYSQPNSHSILQWRAAKDEVNYTAYRLLPTDKLGFVVEGRPRMNVRYCFEPNTPFANIVDPGTEFTRRDCLEFSLFRSPLVNIVNFEPTNHGFIIQNIKVDGSYFVRNVLDDDAKHTSFVFPVSVDISGLILHPPTEVWGYDGEELILGIVTSCHGVHKPFYNWYRNEAVYQEGVNLCCITVTLPGVYFCRVTFEDSYDISQPIQIVEFSDCSLKKPKHESSCVDVNFNCCHFTSDVPSRIIPSVDQHDLDVDFTSKVCNGTFGTVYKASWLGTDVHVEFLNLDDFGPEKDVFIRSIREINSRIRHPNILSLMACVESRVQISLVSEYHEGATLESLIFSAETRQYLALDSVHKLNIALQTCQGLVYLHALSPPIMHRAVYPASVWVLNQGTMAKLCCPNVWRSSQVYDDSNMSLYLAPECLLSPQDGDLAADVWGIGATLTVMMTEEGLWGDLGRVRTSLGDIMTELEHGHSPPALQALTVWKDILTACLNIEPSLRPSVLQLLSQLRN